MASASASSVRSWRTAFLTLRDETLAPLPRSSLSNLLRTLLFSQTEILISATPDLPPREVTSDVMLLVELVASIPEGEDVADTFIATCHLIHNVSSRVCLEMGTSSRVLMLDFLEKMVLWFLRKADSKTGFSGNVVRVKATKEILEIIRNCSFSENTKLIKLLLRIVSCLHAELTSLSYSSSNQQYADNGTRVPRCCNNLWEVQTDAFVMIGDILSKNGSSLSVEMWQSTLEVLRKVMDVLASRSLLVENNIMSRFYTSLLHCLHLVISNPKGSLSEHVAGYVASLQMFFMYGLTNKSQLVWQNPGSKEEYSSLSLSLRLEESRKSERGTYRPPHLRKREGLSTPTFKGWNAQSISSCEASASGISSSDSEHSDSDGSVKGIDAFRSSRARIAAIFCIQDLSQADPKSLSAHWTMLLPTSDVLQPRKYQATLLTCLLFDPILKTRIASASALASMLDGPSAVFLQVAEYKESTKCGSFTTLSTSLGQILMQLHTGLLYLVRHETNNGLLVSVFKVLMLLISATPYARMPADLLPTVISTMQTRILEDLSVKTDRSLQATALSCLGAALSTSPAMLQVTKLLQEGTSAGVAAHSESNVVRIIFQFSQPVIHPTISIEALQALRAALHNYPNVMTAYWDQISATIYDLLQIDSPAYPSYVPSRTWKGDSGSTSGSITEKCIMVAIKVLDESLRATSGFKGTDELIDDKLLHTPFISDCIRSKKISSAPSYEFDGLAVSESNPTSYSSGIKQWCEAIEKHLALTLSHSSPMICSP